jgi:hypothetical protein
MITPLSMEENNHERRPPRGLQEPAESQSVQARRQRKYTRPPKKNKSLAAELNDALCETVRVQIDGRQVEATKSSVIFQ